MKIYFNILLFLTFSVFSVPFSGGLLSAWGQYNKPDNGDVVVTAAPAPAEKSGPSRDKKLSTDKKVVKEKYLPQFIEKPSLRAFANSIQKGEEITSLFKKTRDYLPQPKESAATFAEKVFPENEVDRLLKLNKDIVAKWKGQVLSGEAFLRAEIDEESVLNGVTQALQLTILQVRRDVLHQNFHRIKEELTPWFRFASSLPFEESSLVSLRFCHVIRSLLFDELELIQKFYLKEMTTDPLWLEWTQTLKMSWPIDRVILSESKRLFRNKPLYTAQQVALALQKNNYQSAAEALAKAQGPKTLELKVLEKMWRPEDIEEMKIEINRFHSLQLRWALGLFENKKKKKAQTLQELVTEKIILSIPTNYKTGRTFELNEILN